ncbi:MAG: hypothetical protein EKK64_05590 [Neisseriaceae bacterium]|nr:MAG: hypothetical protein EKK64_05590 [Neisseriaceae bacterium]
MNKKLLVLLAGLFGAVALVACGSGSSSSSPKYITAGVYNATVTNSSNPDICPNDPVGTNISINSQGQACDVDGTGCDSNAVNLNVNPCYSYTANEQGVQVTEVMTGCSQNDSGVFTSTSKLNLSNSGVSISCTYTNTLTPVVLSK